MVKNLNQIIGVIVCFWILISCSSKNSNAITQVSIPNWYLQPENYLSPSVLYGLGAGGNLETAKKRALQNMSYNLQLQVQSSSVSEIISFRSPENQVSTNASLQETVALKSNNITFTAVKTEKIEKIQDQYYALLSIRYDNLIQDNQNKLEKSILSLRDVLKTLPSSNFLQQAILFSRSSPILLEAQNSLENLEVLKIVSKSNNISKLLLQENFDFLRGYLSKELSIKSNITFEIIADEVWETTQNLLANHLQAQGYKIGISANATFRISGKKEENTLFEGKIKQVKLWVLISLEDQEQDELASREFTLQSTSLQTYFEASRKAQAKLKASLTGNIFQLLGL